MEEQQIENVRVEQALNPNEQALLMSFMSVMAQRRAAVLDARDAADKALAQLEGAVIMTANLHGLQGQWGISEDCSKLVRKG